MSNNVWPFVLGIGLTVAALLFHLFYNYPRHMRSLCTAIGLLFFVFMLLRMTGASTAVFWAIVVAYVAIRLWRHFIEPPPSFFEPVSRSSPADSLNRPR